MKKSILFLSAIATMFALFIISCDKEPETDTETQSAVDNAKAEEAVSQMFSSVNHYGINEDGIKNGTLIDSGGCVTITIDTTIAFPRTLTLDFGTVGCVGFDGKVRKGKLHAKYSNHWLNPAAGTYVEATCDNYYVNGEKLEGTFKVTFNGANSYGGPSYTLTATNAKITLITGKQISWNATETIDWIDGYTDLLPSNDVMLISGNSTGTNSAGRAYTMSITKPLKKDMSCQWITEGTIELTPAELNTRTVDFGSGACDNDATVSIKGVVINFKL